ncbi:MAG: hypothetical protein ACK56D_01830, partial [Planctomycetota bacterium]
SLSRKKGEGEKVSGTVSGKIAFQFLTPFLHQWNKHVRPTPALFLERLAKYLPEEQVAKFEKFTTEPWQFNSVPRCNDGSCTDAKSSSVTFSMFQATADI